MKAGNEIKKGWAVVICPKCGVGWGMDPRTLTPWDFTDGCGACPPKPEESTNIESNTEFCERVRGQLYAEKIWRNDRIPSERGDYAIRHLEMALARLERAEKKMSTMIEAPSYFPPGAIYDPAGIYVERCISCSGRGRTGACAPRNCTRCNGTGYIVVKKEKT